MDNQHIELAASASDAAAGHCIDLTAGATGADHSILKSGDVPMPSIYVRTAAPQTTSMSGLAVTAVNQDNIKSAGVSGGVASGVAVNIGGSVHILTTTTRAYAADGAKINNNNTGAGVDQSVLIAAGDDYYHLGIAGAIAGSGTAAVTPGVDVAVVTNTTEAWIGDATVVNAKGDVDVVAKANEEILSISAGAAASGVVAVGGAVSVVVLDDTTHAFIGNDATTSIGGAHVAANGNVLVSAMDNTKIDVIAGSLGLGFGAAGIGASVGVTVITKDTEAYIGNYATVDAKALGGTLSGIYDGDTTSSGFTTVGAFQGLAVQASSSEDLFSIAASAGAGLFLGLAGGVSVEDVGASTAAYIGDYALVNSAGTTSTSQSVNVSAVDNFTSFSMGGGLGAGAAGIGGGVDVGILRNPVSAYIGDYAQINAKGGNVDVNALSIKDIDSMCISIGGGLVGVSGSISVWTIGGQVNSTYSADAPGSSGGSSSDVFSGSSGGTVPGFADDMAGGSESNGGYQSIVNGFTAGSDQSSQQVASATASASGSIGSAAPSGVVSSAVASTAATQGTVAHIGSHAIVSADGDVNIRAKDSVSFKAIVGNVSGGIAAFGASVAIVNMGNNTVAYIGDHATVSAGGAAGDDILVYAGLQENVDGEAFAGNGGVVSIGAQVVVINDTSAQQAYIDTGAAINQAGGTLTVQADAVRDLDASAIGVGFGFAGAAGAAVADTTVGGATQAWITGASIGQVSGETVGNLAVISGSDIIADADSLGVQGGLGVALNGSVALVTVDPTISASIDGSSLVKTSGSVTVQASSQDLADAQALGASVSGTFSLGLAIAVTTSSPTITAAVGIGDVISAGSNVAVRSIHNYSYDPVIGVYTPSTAPDYYHAGTTKTSVNRGAYATAISGSGGGLAAISGAIATATSAPNMQSWVHGTSIIDAGGSVSVSAKGMDTVDAFSVGIAVAGLLGAGVPIATATDSSTTRARVDGNVRDASNPAVAGAASLTILADSNDSAKAEADAGSAGLVSGQYNQSTASVSSDIEAGIGNSSVVNVTGAINISAISQANANADTKGLSAGLAAVGVSKSYATVNPTVDAFITQGNITAGSITVSATHNYSAGSPIAGKGATALADASGGGLIGGMGAVPTALSDASLETYVGSGATLNSSGAITINSQGSDYAYAEADALAIGALAGVGASLPTATANGTTLSHLDGVVTAGASLAISATGYSNASATAEASGGGLISAQLPLASATASPIISAYKGGSGNVTVSGDVGISAVSDSAASAAGSTIGIGAISVGVLQALAYSSPTVDAHIDGGTIRAQDITLTAKHDYDTSRTVSASSEGTSGGLFAIQGATPTADSEASVYSYVASGATLIAGNNITINSLSNANTSASNNGLTVGLVAVGAMSATATTSGLTTAFIDASRVSAGNDITINSQGWSSSTATVNAASGGLVSGGENDATTTTSPNVSAYLAAGSTSAQDIIISSSAQSAASGSSHGVNAGALAVGVSKVVASDNTTLDAHVSGNIDAQSLTISATKTVPTGSYNTNAYASGSAGGLVGVDSTKTTAQTTGTIDSYIADNSTLDIAGAVSVSAIGNTAQTSDASSNTGGLISAGVSTSIANSSLTTQSFIGSSVNISASSVMVDANGSDNNFATTEAGSGGVIAGASATSSTTNTSTTMSSIGNGTTIDVRPDLTTNSGIVNIIDGQTVDMENGNTGGGTVGSRYRYIGSGGAANYTTNSGVESLTLGNTVDVRSGFTGMGVAGHRYEYISHTSGSVNLGAADFTDTSKWYDMGQVRPMTATINLLAENFADTSYWALIPNAGLFQLTAEHTAAFNAQEETTAGGALAGSGASVINLVNADTEANVGNNTIINAKNLAIEADNQVSKGALSGGIYNIKGTTGGVISGAGADSETLLNLTTLVNIGIGAQLSVVGSSASPGEFVLSTLNDIDAYDSIKLETGGALSGASADDLIKTTKDLAAVNVGANAGLESVGDVDISSRGTGNINAIVNGETYGVATVASADSTIDMHPVNQVNVGSNAAIVAEGGLNISAADDTSFNRDYYNLNARTDTFAGSAIPIDIIDANANIMQDNDITVNNGALLETARDAKIYAEQFGIVDIMAKATGTNWLSSTADAINSALGGSSAEEYNGTFSSGAHGIVTINGTIRTGTERNLTLTIDSWNRDAGTVTGTTTINGAAPAAGQEGITYSASTTQVVSGLEAQLENLQNELSTYQSSGNTTMINYYNDEIATTQQQLIDAGLLEKEPDGSYNPIQQYAISANVNPVTADAGIIDIRADQLLGSGSGVLDAPSDASITIVNNTPAFLNLLGLTIPETTGGLYFNGIVMQTDSTSTALQKIANMNASDAGYDGVTPGSAAFAQVTESSAGNPPRISVSNTFDPTGYVDPQHPDDTYSAPSISVLGDINNLQGSLSIYNVKGDINFYALIRAKNMSIVSGGNVYIEGVTYYNVGGDPAAEWSSVTAVSDQIDSSGAIVTSWDASSQISSILSPSSIPSDVNLYGDRIFISADYINIDGNMQSGKAEYDLTLGSAVITEINSITTGGRVKLNSVSSSDFTVYYDTATHSIEVEEVQASGGNIELHGHILNTGANGEGKITARAAMERST